MNGAYVRPASRSSSKHGPSPSPGSQPSWSLSGTDSHDRSSTRSTPAGEDQTMISHGWGNCSQQASWMAAAIATGPLAVISGLNTSAATNGEEPMSSSADQIEA